MAELIETLLVHDDRAVVELLGALLEANGFRVHAISALDAARKRLDAGGREVVITAWDRSLGQDLYRWVLDERRPMRARFVFVADEIPARLEEAAAKQRIVQSGDLAGLVDAIAVRAARLGQARRTRLLLVDDDPTQLAEMAELLSAEGFEVRTAPGGEAAARLLASAEHDFVLSDWSMSDGSGHDLYQWIAAHQPRLLQRLVFMTGGDPSPIRPLVDRVPVIPKGQDSPTLLELLRKPLSLTS